MLCHACLVVFPLPCQIASQILRERSLPVPLHFRCVSDNTSAETKNQIFFKVFAVLAARRVLSSACLAQGRVGHTHGRIDAYFATLARALARTNTLETPEDFVQRVKQTEKGLLVECIHAAYPWTEWIGQLPVNFSGHAQTRKALDRFEEAAHVYKFVRRESLGNLLGDQVDQGSFQDCLPHPCDVILLTKHYMASDELSQPPVLCLPHDVLEQLPLRPMPVPIPRQIFSERQCKEFETTAKALLPIAVHLFCTTLFLPLLAGG